jgi:hypothetical protein
MRITFVAERFLLRVPFRAQEESYHGRQPIRADRRVIECLEEWIERQQCGWIIRQ